VTARTDTFDFFGNDIVVTQISWCSKGPLFWPAIPSAGVVISGAANDAPNVKALVYIAAFELDEGESLDALRQTRTPQGARRSTSAREMAFFGSIQDGFVAKHLPPRRSCQARVNGVVQKPLSINSWHRKIRTTTWKHLPSWYMVVRGRTR